MVGGAAAVIVGSEDAAVVHVSDPVVNQVRVLVRREGRVLRVAPQEILETERREFS